MKTKVVQHFSRIIFNVFKVVKFSSFQVFRFSSFQVLKVFRFPAPVWLSDIFILPTDGNIISDLTELPMIGDVQLFNFCQNLWQFGNFYFWQNTRKLGVKISCQLNKNAKNRLATELLHEEIHHIQRTVHFDFGLHVCAEVIMILAQRSA